LPMVSIRAPVMGAMLRGATTDATQTVSIRAPVMGAILYGTDWWPAWCPFQSAPP